MPTTSATRLACAGVNRVDSKKNKTKATTTRTHIASFPRRPSPSIAGRAQHSQAQGLSVGTPESRRVDHHHLETASAWEATVPPGMMRVTVERAMAMAYATA